MFIIKVINCNQQMPHNRIIKGQSNNLSSFSLINLLIKFLNLFDKIKQNGKYMWSGLLASIKENFTERSLRDSGKW